MKSERRSFIKGVALLFMSNLALAKNVQKEQIKISHLFLQEWYKQEKISPSNYLDNRSTDISASTIQSLKQADFESGEVVSIKGLVLSKTEVAVIASFAEL